MKGQKTMSNDELLENEGVVDDVEKSLQEEIESEEEIQEQPVAIEAPAKERYDLVGNILSQKYEQPQDTMDYNQFVEVAGNYLHKHMEPFTDESNSEHFRNLANAIANSIYMMGENNKQIFEKKYELLQKRYDDMSDIFQVGTKKEYQYVGEIMQSAEANGIDISREEAKKMSKLYYIQNSNQNTSAPSQTVNTKPNIPFIPKGGNSNSQMDNYSDMEKSLMKKYGIPKEVWDNQVKRREGKYSL